MKRHVVLALLASIVFVLPASAENQPIRASMAEAANTAALQNNNSRSSGNTGLLWGGIALMAGGTTLAILGNTALRHSDCLITLTFFICTDEPNRAVWASGVAMSAVGGALAYVGLRKEIQIGPNRIGYRVTW